MKGQRSNPGGAQQGLRGRRGNLDTPEEQHPSHLSPWWQHPVTMVTTEAGRLQDDSGKQGSVLRVTGECGKHAGQAQQLHHRNQSNLAVRIVTAVDHCSWGDFTPRKGTEVGISIQGEVHREEAPTAPPHGASAPRFRTTEGQERRAVNHLHQGQHRRPVTMGRCPEEVHTAW